MTEPEVDETTGLVRRPPPAPYPLGPPTLAAVLDGPLADGPEHLALVDDDRQWTYAQLADAVARAAAALADLGIGPGDRIAWSLPNCAELPIGFLATMRLGAVWVGVNPMLAPPERDDLLADAEASATVTDPADWAARCEQADPAAAPAPPIDPHAPAAIAYTSGSTSRPKGAVHSQHNLLWPGLATIGTDPPDPHHRQGTPLSLTILNMMVLGPVGAWVRGTTGVVLRRGRADELSADIARHRLTHLMLVPTQLHDLVHTEAVDPADLSSLEVVIVGGAGTPAPLRREFAERFGVRAVSGYGLSEAPSGVVRESAADPIEDPAAGHPMPPFQIRIVDDDDNALPPGTEGEICVAATAEGPWAGCWTPTLGYWRRPDETRRALRGGVMHTGDLGAVDERGRLTVHGRRRELILRGGANVSPAEVEAVLVRHPEVTEAVVIGVDDDRLGQRVAAVVTSAVPEPDTDSIRAFCAERLAGYKVPDAIAVVAEMPRGAMGKLLRPRLVDAATDAVSRSTPR